MLVKLHCGMLSVSLEMFNVLGIANCVCYVICYIIYCLETAIFLFLIA
jgi:hypothetical protein